MVLRGPLHSFLEIQRRSVFCSFELLAEFSPRVIGRIQSLVVIGVKSFSLRGLSEKSFQRPPTILGSWFPSSSKPALVGGVLLLGISLFILSYLSLIQFSALED